MKLRIGQGIDTHPFVVNRKLILGGVELNHTHGLEGHSDADALTHAICDAMLGALSLGDIGCFFSDTDPAHKDRNSLDFLQIVVAKVHQMGWVVNNIDSTIIVEEPKLRPYIEAMRDTLAKIVRIDKDQVSIKATRPEKLGALGRKEGLTVHAIVLLQQLD